MSIKVQIRSVYGNSLVYPACPDAARFAEIAGSKTLNHRTLCLIEALSYQIEHVHPTVTIARPSYGAARAAAQMNARPWKETTMLYDPYDTVWTWSTANYTISLGVADEDMDPADSFEFDDDIAFAREGGWHWFCARVQITFGESDEVVGSVYLGGCSYRSLQEFIAPGPGYFRDMIREAVREARQTMAGKILEGVQ